MKRSIGERLIRKHFDATFDGNGEILAAAKDVDHAIRRAKAKAWDECYVRICESALCIAADLKVSRSANPYRGRAKR